MTPAQSKFIKALQTFLPADSLLTDEESLHPYECDGLSAYKQLPLAVALPGNQEEIISIIKICQEFKIPVTTRGAGTGLSGGALPLENGLLLNLARLNKILNINPDDRTARVQPGVRNLAISEAVSGHGLYYAPDPSSQIACSIGGNVAENAGGVHSLKYGLTVHNILKLEIITAEGEPMTIGSQALDSPGYDLLALMTGSEGLLGIITEVTVKLLPKPEKIQVLLVAFDDVVNAGKAVSEIISAGIIPAGLELMDSLAIKAAEDFIHAGYPVDATAILLCEVDGNSLEVSDHTKKIHELCLQCGATEIRIAADEKEQKKLWAGRKAAFPAVGRLAPDYYCMDGTIPRHCLPEVLKRISEMSQEYDLPVANVFHAGDGNLHPLILYDANITGQLEKTEQFGGRILELCVEVGGAITGEHGVGIEKIDQMCVQFQSLELSQFHAIKDACDEQGLLNPGKAVPTLHRCAELGAMHVHDGKLPHPELERF
ncbi:MAG: FAD-linked oxidase C-terminal domain-containing protein [Acidiferrobacterales bacterium]